MFFTPNLLTFYVVLKNAIEMFMYFSKHLVYLGIDFGLICLECRFRKLSKYQIFVRRVNDTGLCYGPVPVPENELFLRKIHISLKVFFGGCLFLVPLHCNFCYCLECSPSWYHRILIKIPHWNFPPCGIISWIGVGTLLRKIWLPIGKHNQLLSCLLRLSGFFYRKRVQNEECLNKKHKRHNSCIKYWEVYNHN